MLRISKLADYGTVIMADMAHRAPQLCSARDIALHTHLRISTVRKLLKQLITVGLLTSVRGTSGGYRLARDPNDISIAEIIYALDTKQGLVECSLQPNDCVLQHVCHVKNNWRLISQSIEAVMESVSLAALAKSSLTVTELENVKRVASRSVKSG